ncbi:MAG: 4'-phosphopantetheinyl transferase superfamily protein [Bacteroidia bacterium]|nr:4'-phosphopantetheinyl transferase superfamily protein [Bacteroidia bacterium]
MPLRYIGNWAGVNWAVWEIQESESDLWIRADLSTSDQLYVQSISHPRRRLEALAARVARKILPPAEYSCLTHSFPWAAAATAPFRVGIDIERRRPFPAHVWSYFTHTSEREWDKLSDFTEWHFWCAKELSYKILRSKYSNISFRNDLRFLGDRVEFLRAEHHHRIIVQFIQTEAWILGIGKLEKDIV